MANSGKNEESEEEKEDISKDKVLDDELEKSKDLGLDDQNLSQMEESSVKNFGNPEIEDGESEKNKKEIKEVKEE